MVDAIAAGEISLMINTPLGVATRDDGYELRRAAVRHGITYATTLAAAQALIAGMQAAVPASWMWRLCKSCSSKLIGGAAKQEATPPCKSPRISALCGMANSIINMPCVRISPNALFR